MAQLVKLFEPGKIGKMEVRNRIAMAPMVTVTSEQGYATERTADYFVERAKGGVGLIIAESSSILFEARSPRWLAVYDDRYIPSLKTFSSAVQEYGAKIALQINHPGTGLFSMRGMLEHPEEIDVVGASAIPTAKDGLAPREATKEDIAHITNAFAEAARRIKEAGFDAVEIHGAHGYLITQFLSPLNNRRTDEYGGSTKNRARFACEVISAMRKKVGPDFPIIFRMTACDFLDGGITLEESLIQVPMFVEAGADCLHVSAAATESFQWVHLTYMHQPGAITYLAEAVKKVVKVPVITVGKINDPLLAEEILQQGKADFVAMGRALLADPYFPNKAKEGRFGDIRRCIYCNNCPDHRSRVRLGGLLTCTVNPAAGRERAFILKPASKPKKVIVIGGGIAGMEAARTLAERGHRVSIYERSDRLGGQWYIACQQKQKGDFLTLLNDLTGGLVKAGGKVFLNTEATRGLVEKEKPDAVVVAAGALPDTPNVPGADGKNVVQANDVILGKAKVGDKAVVIGGRYVGMEVADYLAEQGKKVSIATRRQLGRDVERSIYRTLIGKLIEHGVYIYQNSPLREIVDKGVYLVNNQELMFLEADTVVLAVGVKAENKLVDELKGVVPELYAVGDCVEPRNAMAAMGEAAEVARQI